MARQDDSTFNQGTLVNYYKVLGLENYATLSEVRKAYRGLVKTTHPDVVAPELRDEATEIFKTVLLAYTVLNHPGKKQYYDEQLQSVIDAVKQRVNTHQAKTQQDGSKDAKKSAHKHGVQGKGESTQKSEENAGHKPKHKPKHKHSHKHHGHKSRPIKPPETSEPFIAVPSKPMFWKKWYTLYVVESKPNTWHATWEPNAKQRQQAAQKGILFKCVNYYSGTVLQHVQVPFGVIPDTSKACVLKLAINNSILLNLQVEKVNASGGGWFGVGDSPKPSRPPKVQTASEEWDDEEDSEDDDYENVDDDASEESSTPETEPVKTSGTASKPSSSKGSSTPPAKASGGGASKSHTPYKPSASSGSSSPKTEQSQASEIPLLLEVWEAVLGTEKEVQLPSQGTNEAGLGSVTVPPGIQPNQQLRITYNKESYLFRVSIVIPTNLGEEARNCYEILQHLSSTE